MTDFRTGCRTGRVGARRTARASFSITALAGMRHLTRSGTFQDNKRFIQVRAQARSSGTNAAYAFWTLMATVYLIGSIRTARDLLQVTRSDFPKLDASMR